MKRLINHYILITLFVICTANNFSFAQNVTISGKVRYGNESLQAATVSLNGETKLTDVNGEFAFSVKPGTYTITITHTGYKKTEQTIIAEAGSKKNYEFELTPDDQLEEVTIGSRSRIQRSYLNTPVPVDVFSGTRLMETGQITLTQMLNFLAPSMTVSREVLNEPVTLRGLDPQHVLILVNGIRYHPMAWLFSGGLKGQLGKGSVGNDQNSIPFPAIEKIEILRDGAAAQYGSDAIAGVINIRLKKNTGTFFHSQSGQFYQGDGEKIFAGIYHGIVLKNKRLSADKQGFMSFSSYYRNQGATFRGGTYEGLIYENYPPNANRNDSIRVKQLDDQKVLSRGFNRNAVADNAGNTKFNSYGFTMNSLLPVNKSTEVFFTTIVNSRRYDRGAFFRLPREGTGINYLLYPDGVQPRTRSRTVDITAIAGIKGKTKKELFWDISSSYGINSIRGMTSNSFNVTQTILLGRNAQTSFYTGTDLFKQLTNNINFSKQLLQNKNHLKSLNIGWGAEWRFENYIIKQGEEASWKNYDTLNYPRFSEPSPENILNKSRNVFGAYAELESELKNNWLFNIAGRYEYYTDFGGNIAGKLAARYKFSQNFMIRASVNNGFRAPSLQQRYLTSVAYALNSRRETIVRGTFPNDHSIVRALNVPLLKAEKYINISAGFTSSFSKSISLTVDAYWIQIRDRIVISGTFNRDSLPALNRILNQYPELGPVKQVSFFSNAINTRTKGIDILLDGNWGNKDQSLGISLAANFNSTRLYGRVKTSDTLATIPGSSSTLFNTEDSVRVERGQPGSKILLSFIYKTGKLKLLIRNTRFGKTIIAPLDLPLEIFSPKILTDVSITYSPKNWISITLGANNIANIYPDQLKNYANRFQGGWIYSPEASPFGFNGGYYFLNLNFSF